ncbi:hypothetical protein KUCAC02_000391, partial [Chaenocephalus aceratus]
SNSRLFIPPKNYRNNLYEQARLPLQQGLAQGHLSREDTCFKKGNYEKEYHDLKVSEESVVSNLDVIWSKLLEKTEEGTLLPKGSLKR